MIKTNGKYRPDFAVAPGYTLAETIETKNISQKELSERTGLTRKTINLIIQGKAHITPDTAYKFENVLGMPAGFWINLENNYQETLKRLELEEQAGNEKWILDEVDYNQLVKLGWIDKACSKNDKVINLWKYFEVSSIKNLKSVYPGLLRKSCYGNASNYAVMAWITRGLKIAKQIKTEPYDKDKLKSLIPILRNLSQKKDFYEELVKRCAEAGISFVALPHLNRTFIQGATRWISPEKALLLLSIRYRWLDIFWFSFFHELGHILMHSKKELFIECENDNGQLEKEADDFAANTLIDLKKYALFVDKMYYTRESIVGFSAEIGVHPSIVVGRLAHDKKIHYSKFSDLRPVLDFFNKK
ncbi:MAG: HigA family addiction module antidote protein [Actinobacteria bacterium]|nr:HigA family addiction module antidote protein [Actinomycetota bacterium]